MKAKTRKYLKNGKILSLFLDGQRSVRVVNNWGASGLGR